MTVTEIDGNHGMARISYSAECIRRDGENVTIDFDVTYLLQVSDRGPTIFAYIAGDEQAVLREHGLID